MTMTSILFVMAALFASVNGDEATHRLIGGTEATKGQFPFMASVEIAHEGAQIHTHKCGGAILDSKNIITAAHCLTGVHLADVRVLVGLHQRSVIEDNQQLVGVSRMIVHSGYSDTSPGFPNDIALLHVATDIDLSGSFAKAITPDTVTKRDGETCQHPGWGQLELHGPSSDFLHFIDTPIISNTVCENRFSEFTGTKILSSHICDDENTGPNPCVGDNGGPLVCSGQLTGIGSWGISTCHGYPNVFTRVSSFLSWINANKLT